MKPRTATIVSISAVLVASAAAITINTNIFSGTTALADTAGPASASQPVDTSTAPVTPPAPGTPLASLPMRRQMRGCLAASDVTLAAPVSTTFDVPNIGSVTVARDGNMLRVDAVEVTDGYTSHVKCASGEGVEVEFESAAMDYEFRARVVNDRILTDVSTHDFPRPGGPGTEQPRAERRQHGDDDEGHEHGEDHERDGHEREHHEEGHEDDDD
jgi:hypothetical protein